jgi:hypothetical protein
VHAGGKRHTLEISLRSILGKKRCARPQKPDKNCNIFDVHRRIVLEGRPPELTDLRNFLGLESKLISD